MLLDTLPGMTQQVSWTLTNLLYLSVCDPAHTDVVAQMFAQLEPAFISNVSLGNWHTVSH
jgi:hypothetical protein